MIYKVFLVEDEIVTREGIRDNVDWGAAGFEFCGEATDGETALPLIQESRPDVIITDIKMPFMDGLQLTRIIREKMPWIKIIILSGHNEFDYAQSAVKLGVTEYLLKPISAKDLHEVLVRIAKTLEEEKEELQKLSNLQSQVQDSLTLNREKYFLDLLMGVLPPAEAIEKGEKLGLAIMARYYLVAMIRIHLCQDSENFGYRKYRRVEQIVSEFASNNLDVFLTKKDFEELVLIMKGDDQEQLISESQFLAKLIKNEIEDQIECQIEITFGTIQDRLGNIHKSFLESFYQRSSESSAADEHIKGENQIDLEKIDNEAIENYLRFGSIEEFDSFFTLTIQPLGEIALSSDLMKQYLFVHLIIRAAEAKRKYEGNSNPLLMEISNLEKMLSDINSMEAIKAETHRIIRDVLNLRNEKSSPERIQLMHQITIYLEEHFTDPNLKISEMAKHFNITPSYLSSIYREENGETLRDSLINYRIIKAKELLRTTNRNVSEISFQCGFNDAHYFSHRFKLNTGLTPSQFRHEFKDNKQEE